MFWDENENIFLWLRNKKREREVLFSGEFPSSYFQCSVNTGVNPSFLYEWLEWSDQKQQWSGKHLIQSDVDNWWQIVSWEVIICIELIATMTILHFALIIKMSIKTQEQQQCESGTWKCRTMNILHWTLKWAYKWAYNWALKPRSSNSANPAHGSAGRSESRHRGRSQLRLWLTGSFLFHFIISYKSWI